MPMLLFYKGIYLTKLINYNPKKKTQTKKLVN